MVKGGFSMIASRSSTRQRPSAKPHVRRAATGLRGKELPPLDGDYAALTTMAPNEQPHLQKIEAFVVPGRGQVRRLSPSAPIQFSNSAQLVTFPDHSALWGLEDAVGEGCYERGVPVAAGQSRQCRQAHAGVLSPALGGGPLEVHVSSGDQNVQLIW
jgi:hypothetical protein